MQALHAAARYLDRLPASARVAVAVLPELDAEVRFDEPHAVLKDRLLRAVGTGRRTVPLAQTSDDRLNALFTSLSAIEGPKQVVVIQGTRPGEIGAPVDFAVHDLLSAALSAWQSRVIVHELKVWENPGWAAMSADSSASMPLPQESASDRILSTETGGLAMAPVSGDAFFTRFAREQAGSYVLAFDPSDSDRDGRSHTIKVAVSRPDTTIRARHDFSIAGATGSH